MFLEPTDEYEEIDPEWTPPPVLPKRAAKPATSESKSHTTKEPMKGKTTQHTRAEHGMQKEKAQKTGGNVGKKEKETAKQISTHLIGKNTDDLKIPKREPITTPKVPATDFSGEQKTKREYQNTMIGRATVKPFVQGEGQLL